MSRRRPLRDILIQVLPGADDWQDAIRLSLKPLIDTFCIEPRYSEAIIANTLEFGPYYIIMPDIALVHGRPSQGVRCNGFSLTRFEDPILFPNTDDPVHLFLAMSANDDESHLKDMQTLSDILLDEKSVERLRAGRTQEDLQRIFRETA